MHIVAYNELKIGNDVLMASKIFISDSNHGCYTGENQDSPESKPNARPLVCSRVSIGDRVWIGENAVILAGSRIGSGCIVGANSVVKGEFPDNTMIVGSPARVVKYWDGVIWKTQLK